nr:MAG TPA: hypothetical protein [Caudoviricetes sp.]
MYPSFRTISVQQGVICCRIKKILYVIKKTKCVCSQNASKRIGNKKASILNCQFVFIVEITRRGSYAFFN